MKQIISLVKKLKNKRNFSFASRYLSWFFKFITNLGLDLKPRLVIFLYNKGT